MIKLSAGNKAVVLALALLFAGCRQDSAGRHYLDLEDDIQNLISEENTIGFSPLLDRTGRMAQENWKYTDIIKNVLIREGLIEPYSTADDVFRELNRRYLRWNDVPALETLLTVARAAKLGYLIVVSVEDVAVVDDYPQITIGLRIYRVRDGRILYYDESTAAASANQYNVPGRRKKTRMELTVEICERLIEKFAENIEPHLKSIKGRKVEKVRRMLKESEALGLNDPDARWIKESRSLLDGAAGADGAKLRDVRTIFQIENKLHSMILDYKVKAKIIEMVKKP